MPATDSVLRKILRWCAWLVLGLGALIVLLLALVWAVNMHDEALTEQAQLLLQPPPNPYAPEDNLYLALVGFDATSGAAPTAVGQARLSAYNARMAAHLHDPHPSSVVAPAAPEDSGGALKFQGDMFSIRSYWHDVPSHAAEVAKLLADNRELVDRYAELHHRRGYCDDSYPNFQVPLPATLPKELRALFLADVVLRLRSADARQRQQALADLRDDLSLWHRMLTGEGAIISKLLAIAYIHWDSLVLADVIADPDAAVPLTDADSDAIAPLFELADWDIGRAYANEYRAQASLMQQTDLLSRAGYVIPDDAAGAGQRAMQRLNGRISRHFFKLHATENLFAEQAVRLAADAAPAAAARAPRDTFAALASLRTVYNPLGKILVAIAAAPLQDYPRRAWDGAAFQRLVRLAWEIRRQRLDAAAIPDFMRSHPELATHPATHRPFVFDPEHGQIRVETLARQEASRAFAVPVWKAAAGR